MIWCVLYGMASSSFTQLTHILYFGTHNRSSRLALANNYDHCPVLYAFPLKPNGLTSHLENYLWKAIYSIFAR